MFRRPPPRAASLAELRDVTTPALAARVGAEFGREAAPDLRRVRPWLPRDLPAEAVVGAVFTAEWTGFLALLDEQGPWVYVPDVSALQGLAAARACWRAAAMRKAAERDFWQAAQHLAAQRRHTWRRKT